MELSDGPDDSPRAAWRAWEGRAELIALTNDEALAEAIFHAIGPTALEWLELQVPALGGRKPTNCLRSKQGRRALRRVLARFPR